MSDKYVLDAEHNTVPADLETWARFFEDHEKRRVGIDRVGRYRISTVFLGIDHSFGDAGPPQLFETMVFEGDSNSDIDMDRCATWAEAEAMHARFVEKYTAEGGA